MESWSTFVVRLPNNKYQSTSGEPIDSAAQAKHFETLEEALSEASVDSIGISEYDERMHPQSHLSLEDAESFVDLTKED